MEPDHSKMEGLAFPLSLLALCATQQHFYFYHSIRLNPKTSDQAAGKTWDAVRMFAFLLMC